MNCDFIIGDAPILTLTVYDTEGELVDATVNLTVETPDGVQTMPALDHPSTGRYQTSNPVDFDTAGYWVTRWEATTTEGTKVCEKVKCVCASALVGAS